MKILFILLCRTGSGGFFYGIHLVELHIYSGTINNMKTAGSGSAIAVHHSELVNMSSVTIQSCSGTGLDSSGFSLSSSSISFLLIYFLFFCHQELCF